MKNEERKKYSKHLSYFYSLFLKRRISKAISGT
jgi:hypothetical protein